MTIQEVLNAIKQDPTSVYNTPPTYTELELCQFMAIIYNTPVETRQQFDDRAAEDDQYFDYEDSLMHAVEYYLDNEAEFEAYLVQGTTHPRIANYHLTLAALIG